MESVSREEVISSWLRRDLEKHSDQQNLSIEELGESERAASLLELNPDAASAFLKHSFNWYKTTLSKAEFQQLYTVWENLGVPDYTVTELGNSLVKEGSRVSKTIAESNVDRQKIREIADEHPNNSTDYPLIITVVVSGTPRIADGNHRATGLALHMAQGGDYQPQEAYIGFTIPPKIQNRLKNLRTKALDFERIW